MTLTRCKFPAAAGADQTVEGQGTVPIIFFIRQAGPDFLDDFPDRLLPLAGGLRERPGTPSRSEGSGTHDQFPFLLPI
jgi:hypothetical protein